MSEIYLVVQIILSVKSEFKSSCSNPIGDKKKKMFKKRMRKFLITDDLSSSLPRQSIRIKRGYLPFGIYTCSIVLLSKEGRTAQCSYDQGHVSCSPSAGIKLL